jgi:hypothetical protein
MLNNNDLEFLLLQGINKQDSSEQLSLLKDDSKLKKLLLIRPCDKNDGILPPEDVQKINIESSPPMPGIFISRFIPASGSATRMFNFDLFEDKFFEKVHLLPFFNQIESFCSEKKIDLKNIILDKDSKLFNDILTSENKLNLSTKPKAIIDLHQINSVPISPIEQFLVNSMDDITNSPLVFSIQENYVAEVQDKVNHSSFLADYNPDLMFEITTQKKSTNSLCVDNKGEILRHPNGEVYTHPSGHGALLENLGEIDSDFIFINNIDNLSPKTRTLRYEVSKSLFNIAYSNKRRFDMLLQTLSERKYNLLESLIAQFEAYMPNHLKDKSVEQKVDLIIEMLNKPIRVCGVVKDENSKGGKPFWVNDGKAESVQIVEESQVDLKDENQIRLWEEGSYFNPVEMICCIKDFTGKRFDLKQFSEDSLRMKVNKDILGKSSSFIECPGLWNGSMHYWHTTFVEIPGASFTPVKNFTDLFLSIHQP